MGVKWFTKSLFFSLGLVLLLIMFFSVNSSVFSLSQDKAGAYAGCGNSVINFIGKNNDTIYSVDLPADKSLNDLENSNLLKNSDFSILPQSGVTTQNFYISGSKYDMALVSDGLHIFNTTGKAFLIQDKVTSEFLGKSVTFSCSINGVIKSLTWRLPNSINNSVGTSGVKVIDGVYIRLFSYNLSRLGVTFDFLAGYDLDFIINWSKFEISETATPYYSADYVQKLYGEKLDNYVWSMSPVNYTPYDFDKHTPSTSLHYVKNKPIFSLVDTWNRYVLMLNNQSSTTMNALNRVKEKWSHILEISDNMSNIFSSSSSSSPFDNPSGVLNIGGYFKDKVIRFIGNIFSMIFNLLVLVFYFFILVISPVIDMFSYLVAIIIGGDINSWSFLN